MDDRRGERARVAALAERSGTVRLGDVISRLCGGGLPFTPRNRSSTESCDSRTNPFVLLLKGPLGPPALRSSWAYFSRGMDRSKLVRSTVEPGLNPCPKKLCMEPELVMNLDPRPSRGASQPEASSASQCIVAGRYGARRSSEVVRESFGLLAV